MKTFLEVLAGFFAGVGVVAVVNDIRDRLHRSRLNWEVRQ